MLTTRVYRQPSNKLLFKHVVIKPSRKTLLYGVTFIACDLNIGTRINSQLLSDLKIDLTFASVFAVDK